MAAVIPPWQAPDEPKHFEYVASLYDTWRFRGRLAERPNHQPRIIASMGQNDFWRFGYSNSPPETSYSFAAIWQDSPTMLHRPPLFYAVGALAYGAVSRQDVLVQVYLLRLVSVLMGASLVAVAYLAARSLFPGDRLLSTAVPAVVALLPMPLFIAGSVSSDNLANLIGGLFILGVTRGLKSHFSGRLLVVLGLLFVAGLYTKRTLVFAAPVLLVAVLLQMLSRDAGAIRRKKLAVYAAVPVAAFVVSLPFWNWLGAARRLLDRYVFDSTATKTLEGFSAQDYTLDQLLDRTVNLLGMMHQSFWAQFGWMNVRFEDVWYYGLAGLASLAFTGVLLLFVRGFRGSSSYQPWQRRTMYVYVVAVALVLLIALGQALLESLPGTQGRYLFPALIPAAALLVLGIGEVLPAAHRAPAIGGIIASLFLLGFSSVVFLILPFYYG